MATAPTPLGWGRSLLFSSGDFACNLYWQSITFYLLFFYTDTLGLSAALAGLITLIASVWDGLAALIIGVAADRRSSRAFVRVNAVPLGIAFVLLYLPVPLQGAWLAGFALIAHMLFRTLYVAVNVPYAALTVQIAPDSASRSRIAGLRMILGAGAAFVVAIGTQACIGLMPRIGYAAAAGLFGIVATAMLFVVGSMRPVAAPLSSARPPFRFRAVVATIAGNRAFAMVNLGICGAVAAMAVLTRAIPYYFKYEVGDVAAGSAALAMMSIAGVLAIPLWMFCAARLGHRAQWQISAVTAGLALIGLLVLRPTSILPAQMLFILFQAGGQGLFFGFWALIPDVVEHGGRPGSLRMDTFLFGIAALMQKVTMGVAVAVFGALLSWSGYVAGEAQSPRVLSSLIWLTAALPLLGLAGASGAMLRFPRSLVSRD
ncbi:MFS transporter [Sphingomonas crusticola]|uniref:MFS transporter n=1 Tax=Sphingomonas crusticola TaxID=1697973 RepID=UPI0013C2E089|nr:MFS transporter [Sphingomonas crusticola]